MSILSDRKPSTRRKEGCAVEQASRGEFRAGWTCGGLEQGHRSYEDARDAEARHEELGDYYGVEVGGGLFGRAYHGASALRMITGILGRNRGFLIHTPRFNTCGAYKLTHT